MAANELSELLETAAPAPDRTLDIGHIKGRAHRRRRRRQVSVTCGSLLVVGSVIGLALQLSGSPEPDRVVAGPAGPPKIPLEWHAGTATTEIGLLDGTRLRLTVPEEIGRILAGMTQPDLRWNGMVYAVPVTRPPRAWGILAARVPLERLVPRGEPLPVPASSRASAASVDHEQRRLGLQFGSWSVAAHGDSLTETDIKTLLAGLWFVETPDGFLEYRGSLPLWPVDGPDAALAYGNGEGVSVFIQRPADCLPAAMEKRPTGGGLEEPASAEFSPVRARHTDLCDPVNHLRISLLSGRTLTDAEVDQIKVEVLSVGPTLAAMQRGETPFRAP